MKEKSGDNKGSDKSFFAIKAKQRRRTMMKVMLPIVGVIIGIGALVYYYPPALPTTSSGVGSFGSAHVHSAFMLALDGRIVDLAKPEYMTKDNLVHVEGMDGNTIHRHATEANLGRFFSSIGMGTDHATDCFKGDDGKEYCNDPSTQKRMRLWVNGEELQGHVDNYVTFDGDRILVVYGNEGDEQITEYLDALNAMEIQET